MKKRALTASVFVILFLLICVSRLGYIAISGNYMASKGYNSYSLTVSKRPYNLYYSDFSKLTNNVRKYTLVIIPNEKGVYELHGKFSLKEEQQIIKLLREGKPVAYNLKTKDSFKYNKVYECYETESTLNQLINKSSGGLLSNLPEEALKINYTVDAMGKMLSGDKGREVSDEYYNSYGYVLTLNKNIQNITYNACKNMKSGCAVVMDVKTASILALVTKPDNSYINKPFQLYSAGSIFKIVVALCALENNIDISYKCSGRIRVGDTVFSCQNEHVHLKQNLKEALANSCNCYFVNLALNLGKVKLTDTARELGLNDNTDLFDNIIINNAKLPDSEDLSSKGELALLGFGQGKLQITPLHFCNIMCTVANNGNQNNTRLIKYAIDKENTVSEIYYSNNRARIKPVCCNKLCDYLRYTVSDGTAKNADFNNQCAGKTATAQTGQYKSGCEMYNTWFAGFYPYNEPEYAIVIMFENGISGSIDCCPVFRTIVENLERL